MSWVPGDVSGADLTPGRDRSWTLSVQFPTLIFERPCFVPGLDENGDTVELVVNCPHNAFASRTLDIEIAPLASTVPTLSGIGPYSHFTVLLNWIGASHAGAWSGCGDGLGDGNNYCHGGTPSHPTVQNSVATADMTDVGTWLDEAGGGPLPTSDLVEDNHLGDGYPWGPVGNVLFWPAIPGQDLPRPVPLPKAWLLSSAPDVSGVNEWLGCLLTPGQLPALLQIVQGLSAYATGFHGLLPRLTARLTIRGYFPTPDPPPPPPPPPDGLPRQWFTAPV